VVVQTILRAFFGVAEYNPLAFPLSLNAEDQLIRDLQRWAKDPLINDVLKPLYNGQVPANSPYWLKSAVNVCKSLNIDPTIILRGIALGIFAEYVSHSGHINLKYDYKKSFGNSYKLGNHDVSYDAVGNIGYGFLARVIGLRGGEVYIPGGLYGWATTPQSTPGLTRRSFFGQHQVNVLIGKLPFPEKIKHYIENLVNYEPKENSGPSAWDDPQDVKAVATGVTLYDRHGQLILNSTKHQNSDDLLRRAFRDVVNQIYLFF
jgi:Bacterial toxin 44